jgi:hypothetical protein
MNEVPGTPGAPQHPNPAAAAATFFLEVRNSGRWGRRERAAPGDGQEDHLCVRRLRERQLALCVHGVHQSQVRLQISHWRHPATMMAGDGGFGRMRFGFDEVGWGGWRAGCWSGTSW